MPGYAGIDPGQAKPRMRQGLRHYVRPADDLPDFREDTCRGRRNESLVAQLIEAEERLREYLRGRQGRTFLRPRLETLIDDLDMAQRLLSSRMNDSGEGDEWQLEPWARVLPRLVQRRSDPERT